MFTCCFGGGSSSVGVGRTKIGSNKLRQEELDYYEFLAPSVYHLNTSLLQQIEDAGLSEDSTVRDIEDLGDSTPGLIRRKGKDMKCPIDGRMGSAYVHTLEGKDHVGTATYMLVSTRTVYVSIVHISYSMHFRHTRLGIFTYKN